MEIHRSLLEDLHALQATAERNHIPVLNRWLHLTSGRVLDTAFPDERTVIAQVGRMLATTRDYFLFEPQGVNALRARYEAIVANPDPHLLQVALHQRAQIRATLGNGNLVKLLNNRQRGLERREIELDQAFQALDDAPAQLLNDIVRILQKPRYARRMPDYSERIQRLAGRIAILMAEIDDAETDIERLGIQIEMQSLYAQTISRIEATIKELQGRMPRSTVASEKLPASVPASEARPSPLVRDRVPTSSRPAAIAPAIQAPAEPTPETPDLFVTDLQRVNDAISLSQSNGGHLRILIPLNGKARQQRMRQWQALITALGYQGRVSFIEELESIPESTAPVIVPRQMHTHTARWKRRNQAPLFIVTIPPQLLLNCHSMNQELDGK